MGTRYGACSLIDMQQNAVIFYGTVCSKGYYISYLLLERKIEHEFVLTDDFILSVKTIRDIGGYDRISQYLERYEYLVDIWR